MGRRSRNNRLGPMRTRDVPKAIVGPLVDGFHVASWCPTPDSNPEAVAVLFEITGLGEICLRLKSPSAVDAMIQALLRHKRDVWPDAP